MIFFKLFYFDVCNIMYLKWLYINLLYYGVKCLIDYFCDFLICIGEIYKMFK